MEAQLISRELASHFGLKSKLQRHYIYASSTNSHLQTFTYLRSMQTPSVQHQTCIPCTQRISKKYCKVNDQLKRQFLTLIILHNKSIKEASQTLNINYSSAKAILASHRKHLHATKVVNKSGINAAYKELNIAQNPIGTFKIISSIGGCEISTFDQYEHQKQFYKSSIAPVILLQNQKEIQCSEQTEHKSDL